MTAALPPPPPPSTAPGAAGLGQSLTLSAPCELLSGPNSNVTSVVETSLIQVYRVTFKNHFHEQVFVFSCVSSFDHSLMQCIFFFYICLFRARHAARYWGHRHGSNAVSA